MSRKDKRATTAPPVMMEPILTAADEWTGAGAEIDTRHIGDQPRAVDSGGDPLWEDNQEWPLPAMQVTRSAAIARIVAQRIDPGRAVQFFDLFDEYREATLNIRRHGVIATHKRDLNPMENPYLGRRDKARSALERFKDIAAPWLWAELAIDDEPAGETK